MNTTPHSFSITTFSYLSSLFKQDELSASLNQFVANESWQYLVTSEILAKVFASVRLEPRRKHALAGSEQNLFVFVALMRNLICCEDFHMSASHVHRSRAKVQLPRRVTVAVLAAVLTPTIFFRLVTHPQDVSDREKPRFTV